MQRAAHSASLECAANFFGGDYPMTVINRIAEHLQQLRTTEEINPYVHKLLLARLDSLAVHYKEHGSIEKAIRQEYEHFSMEPGYADYGTCLVPITQEEALEQYDSDCGVLLVYPDNTEGYCQDREDIVGGDFCYANEVQEPVSLLYLIEQEQAPSPKMVYIASPLRGDYNTNIKNAVEYCKNACDAGVLALAPHIIFSQWCNDTVPEQREQGLKLGLSLLEKSEELWVMGEHISEGMRGEMEFAKEHDIPIFQVTKPFDFQSYPVSIDGNALLQQNACIDGSMDADLTGCLVVLQHSKLKQENRSPINQLWIATHGPGCHTGSFTGTVHLTHPVDGDKTCVGRHELCGIATPATIAQMKEHYPQLAAVMRPEPQAAEEQDEDMCR